jgi:hypothetical protein
VKCPVSNEDIVFKLKQHSNNYDWFLMDTRLASGSSEIWGDVGDAVKNILTLSPNN